MNFVLTTLFSAIIFLWVKFFQMHHELSVLRSMVVKELAKQEAPKTEPKQDPKSKAIHCSFCNKDKSEVEMIISGDNVYICNECIGSCQEIMQTERERHKQKMSESPPFENRLLDVKLFMSGEKMNTIRMDTVTANVSF